MLQVSSHLPHTTVRNPVETPGHVSPVSDLRLREPNLCRPLVQDEIHPPSPLTLLSSHVRKTQKYPIPTPTPNHPTPLVLPPPRLGVSSAPRVPRANPQGRGLGEGRRGRNGMEAEHWPGHPATGGLEGGKGVARLSQAPLWATKPPGKGWTINTSPQRSPSPDRCQPRRHPPRRLSTHRPTRQQDAGSSQVRAADPRLQKQRHQPL